MMDNLELVLAALIPIGAGCAFVLVIEGMDRAIELVSVIGALLINGWPFRRRAQ